MLENFLVAVNAVTPLFLLMFVGVFIKWQKLLSETELKHLNKMIFTVFFCAMLFCNLYKTDFHQTFQPSLLIFAFTGVIFCFITAIIVVFYCVKANTTRGAMIQAIFRSNFIILGIPMVANVYGPENIGITSMLIAVVVPLYNVLSVIILETLRGSSFKLMPILIGICKNPMIIGGVVGLTLNLLGVTVPNVLLKPISQISAATSPMALIVLGASVSLSTMPKNISHLIWTVLGRLIIVPCIILPLAVLMGFRGVEFLSLIAVFCTPTAVVSFAIAQQMNSDADLAGSAVVCSTLLSCFTLVMWIFISKTIGLL